nr:MAG TPA: hypothetical protein [Caudoviricetes sp.]
MRRPSRLGKRGGFTLYIPVERARLNTELFLLRDNV